MKRILSLAIYAGATLAVAVALMQPAFSQGACCGSCAQGCTLYGVGGTPYSICLCGSGESCKPVE